MAIKSSGAPKVGNPFLEIVAYALVVEKENIIYWYNKEKLGHCINVEFIKTGIKKQLSLGGYARTIHHIVEEIEEPQNRKIHQVNTEQVLHHTSQIQNITSFKNISEII